MNYELVSVHKVEKHFTQSIYSSYAASVHACVEKVSVDANCIECSLRGKLSVLCVKFLIEYGLWRKTLIIVSPNLMTDEISKYLRVIINNHLEGL